MKRKKRLASRSEIVDKLGLQWVEWYENKAERMYNHLIEQGGKPDLSKREYISMTLRWEYTRYLGGQGGSIR